MNNDVEVIKSQPRLCRTDSRRTDKRLGVAARAEKSRASADYSHREIEMSRRIVSPYPLPSSSLPPSLSLSLSLSLALCLFLSLSVLLGREIETGDGEGERADAERWTDRRDGRREGKLEVPPVVRT